MKSEVMDVDKIMIASSEIGNRLFRFINKELMKTDSYNIDGGNRVTWGWENKYMAEEIINDNKKLIIQKVKQYFIMNDGLSGELKKEIIKQNMMNYFANGDFKKKKQMFLPWTEKRDMAIKEILDTYEKMEAKVNGKRSYSVHASLNQLAQSLSNDNNKDSSLSRIKIEMTKSDCSEFLNDIMNDMVLNAINECIELTDFNKDNEFDLNHIRLNKKLKEEEESAVAKTRRIKIQ